MCLAIPALITAIGENSTATVDMLGVQREAALDLTPDAAIGDYVLIHAGFAIQIISEADAQETLDLLNEFPELIA
jgi:hydrogenase expression/formation protein HypC